MTLGLMAGMMTIGVAVGMAFPSSGLWRVLTASVGVLGSWLCLRGLRLAKDRALADEVEQEEVSS